MFYLSLILILSGILFFIYSLFFESKGHKKIRNFNNDIKEETKKAADNSNLYFHGREKGNEKDLRTISRRKNDIKNDNQDFIDEEKQNFDNLDDIPVHDEIHNREISQDDGSLAEEVNVLTAAPPLAILFDDSSNVIDYIKESGIIDSTLEKYKKIKRIGRGKFILEKDGINFHIGRKLYRFDFHRIKDISAGNNFVALFSKGGDSIKMFLFEKKSDMINVTMTKFQDYKSSLLK